MYSWRGTLTAAVAAYNPAGRREGISRWPAVLRRPWVFFSFLPLGKFLLRRCASGPQGEIAWTVPFFYPSVSLAG